MRFPEFHTLTYETSKTTLELIHLYVISKAKNLLVEWGKSISEIAYRFGFAAKQSPCERHDLFFRFVQKRSGGLVQRNLRIRL